MNIYIYIYIYIYRYIYIIITILDKVCFGDQLVKDLIIWIKHSI